jgi:hypothetical protein
MKHRKPPARATGIRQYDAFQSEREHQTPSGAPTNGAAE